jgi:hypothetical protein
MERLLKGTPVVLGDQNCQTSPSHDLDGHVGFSHLINRPVPPMYHGRVSGQKRNIIHFLIALNTFLHKNGNSSIKSNHLRGWDGKPWASGSATR